MTIPSRRATDPLMDEVHDLSKRVQELSANRIAIPWTWYVGSITALTVVLLGVLGFGWTILDSVNSAIRRNLENVARNGAEIAKHSAWIIAHQQWESSQDARISDARSDLLSRLNSMDTKLEKVSELLLRWAEEGMPPRARKAGLGTKEFN